MHRHDLNLIAALADGSLDDETQARARVDSCQVCHREYEAQVSLLAVLNSTEQQYLSEQEKATLHRDLWTALRTGEPTAQPAIPWWYRWSYAAAGLLLVVGLVGVISQVGDGGDDAATETLAEIGSGLGDEEADDGATAETFAAARAGDADDAVTNPQEAPAAPADTDVAESLDAAAGADFAALTQTLKDLRNTGQAVTIDDQELFGQCLGEAGLDSHRVIETYTVEGKEYLAVISIDAADDSDQVTYVDPVTCEVVPDGE
jgi:hypothetical protein